MPQVTKPSSAERIPYWWPHGHAPVEGEIHCNICGERLDPTPLLASKGDAK